MSDTHCKLVSSYPTTLDLWQSYSIQVACFSGSPESVFSLDVIIENANMTLYLDQQFCRLLIEDFEIPRSGNNITTHRNPAIEP